MSTQTVKSVNTGRDSRRTSSSGTPGKESRGRGFWLAYSAAWGLYAGLILVAGYVEDRPWPETLAGLFVMVVPAASLGALVAVRRRALFSPDRAVLRHLGLHVVVALAYGVGCVAATWALIQLLAPVYPAADKFLETPLFLHVFVYAFLYVILAGFLMWSESIVRVQESRAEVAREAMLRAQAEARATRAQFNPHFVFNTLHSLMLLVRADPPAAERAIEDVAALIRYGSRLQREDRDTAPMEEELASAQRYLALEKLRLEDRLTVEWAVEDGLSAVPVPALSLQTLLENAVKHGLSPRPSGGRIRVSVEARDGAVILAVEDDGEGADPAELLGTDGQGLRLLEDRIRFLHGEAGGLSWRTEPGEGFRAEIRVPWGGEAG